MDRELFYQYAELVREYGIDSNESRAFLWSNRHHELFAMMARTMNYIIIQCEDLHE